MTHYVNNEKFVEELVAYKERLKENPDERVPEYLGTCLVDIATRFASRPNFYGYSYKDEMIADGIENCLTYIANFDPEKSNNAFAYFTQICFYAFLRRIKKEKKQSYVKHKLLQELPMEFFDHQEHDDQEMSENHMSFIHMNNSFDHEGFERGLNKKKQKESILDEFMDDEDVDENRTSD